MTKAANELMDERTDAMLDKLSDPITLMQPKIMGAPNRRNKERPHSLFAV